MRTLFYNFFQNIRKCFSGVNLLLQALAIVLTYIIVVSGFDWLYFISARGKLLNLVLFPAVILGALLPIIIPVVLILVGKIKNNNKILNTAWALGQSAIIGFGISIFYKAFTGRVQPALWNTLVDSSRNFQFGFLRHGIFWGWPSSHTTVAFAMAITLIYLFPKNKLVKILAIVYAFYIGFGISISIHWFSEFIAGALFGTIVGTVVGKSFMSRLEMESRLSYNNHNHQDLPLK